MKITKLEKEANYIGLGSCKIKVEVEITAEDLMHYDYSGLDKLRDEDIPDILVAIGRMYKNRIKNGKIDQDKVGSLLP